MKYLLSLLLLIGCGDSTEVKQNLEIDKRQKEAIKMVEQLNGNNNIDDLAKFLNEYQDIADGIPSYRRIYDKKMTLVWEKTLAENTPEAFDAFLSEYGGKDEAKTLKAKRLKKVAGYIDKLKWDEVKMTKTNMANDPTGPLNGWKFETQITNEGDKSIDFLKARIEFLDADGKVVGYHDEYNLARDTVIIGYLYKREKVTPNNRKPPFETGHIRKWKYTTADTPAKWNGRKFNFLISDIRFSE